MKQRKTSTQALWECLLVVLVVWGLLLFILWLTGCAPFHLGANLSLSSGDNQQVSNSTTNEISHGQEAIESQKASETPLPEPLLPELERENKDS